MKRTFFALCAGFILLSFPAKAISYWEGTAVASNYGEFPSSGLYAACSSFPRNTLVEVTNLDNSKSVQVLVTRSLDNPGVFIALSPEAASQILIQIGMVARVKVALPQTGMDNLLRYDSPGLSQDPDLNPQALVERERMKADSGLANAPSPGPTPSAAAIAIAAPTPKPSPAILPLPTPGASAKPETIAALRQQPEPTTLALKPRNLPETPLSEKTPSAVEARTGSPAADIKPEAVARMSSKETGAKRLPPYALESPELGAQSTPPPLVAQVYEASTQKGPAAAKLSGDLALPGLQGREKPENPGFARLAAPASYAGELAAALAAPEINGVGPQEAAEAFEIAKKVGYGTGVPLISSLELPEIEEGKAETASVEERLVALKKAAGLTDEEAALALADPELGAAAPAETGPQDVAERLLAGRRNPSEEALALEDPEIGSEAKDEGRLLSADERLLASKKRPGEAANLALSDPVVGSPAQDPGKLASVDERLGARIPPAGAELSFGKSDPELEAAPPEAKNLPPEALAALTEKPKPGAGLDLALAGPELAPAEKEVGPEIAAASRPEEPKGAHDLLAFEKASPDLALAEETKPVQKTVEVPVEKAIEKPIEKPAQKAGPEIVESYRKGAEALTALNARRLGELGKGAYYVQVGVFRSGQGAAQAISGLTPNYPLSFQELDSKDSTLYRVYVGPIRKDESGVVMVKLKSLGFKDAFVRKGD